MKVRVKISAGNVSLAAQDHSNPMMNKFLPGRGNLWKNCEFFYNDASIIEADYWVVIGESFIHETCLCPKENVIFMACEPPQTIRYDSLSPFINQFYRLYVSHEQAKHPRVYKAHSPMNWWVDAGHPIKSGDDFKEWKGEGFGYDEFKKMREYEKPKLISVFCSNKVYSPGHRARLDFCIKAKEHFGDQLDWFGAGVRDMPNKWDGIAPYKYHLSLENSSSNDYWTEKLADAFMAGAYPIYYGAPNIHDYFDREMLTQIDIRHPKTALAIIEKVIAENTYEKSKEKILQAKDLVMDKHNLYNLISEIVAADAGKYGKKEMISLKNWDHFLALNPDFLIVKKKNFFQRIKNSLHKKFVKLQLALTDYFLSLKLK